MVPLSENPQPGSGQVSVCPVEHLAGGLSIQKPHALQSEAQCLIKQPSMVVTVSFAAQAPCSPMHEPAVTFPSIQVCAAVPHLPHAIEVARSAMHTPASAMGAPSLGAALSPDTAASATAPSSFGAVLAISAMSSSEIVPLSAVQATSVRAISQNEVCMSSLLRRAR